MGLGQASLLDAIPWQRGAIAGPKIGGASRTARDYGTSSIANITPNTPVKLYWRTPLVKRRFVIQVQWAFGPCNSAFYFLAPVVDAQIKVL
jgi:hypothetical protein